MRILGIDPGFERLGVAILERNKIKGKELVLFSECFKTSARLFLSSVEFDWRGGEKNNKRIPTRNPGD